VLSTLARITRRKTAPKDLRGIRRRGAPTRSGCPVGMTLWRVGKSSSPVPMTPRKRRSYAGDRLCQQVHDSTAAKMNTTLGYLHDE
jgi:hypothetical protein